MIILTKLHAKYVPNGCNIFTADAYSFLFNYAIVQYHDRHLNLIFTHKKNFFLSIWNSESVITLNNE